MLHLVSLDLTRQKIQALFIPVCDTKPIHADPAVVDLVNQALAIREFKGKKDQEVTLYRPAGCASERVVFRGVGKAECLDAEGLRRMAGKSVKRGIQLGLPRLWLAAPDPAAAGIEEAGMLRAMMEGAYLGNHVFDRYKQDKETKPLARIDLVVPATSAARYRRLPAEIRAICSGTLLAREWVDLPSNDKPPEHLAALIARQAKAQGLGVEVLDERELRRKNMGALLAVAAGSSNRPAMVILRHKAGSRRAPVVLVGKGVTFDSGGINLKTGEYLADMKGDMAGAAAVAAALITAARLNLKRHLIGVIPLVENMLSGRSTRPGDIVKTFAGKTVEIGNTDAEGRLILIDAMAYAEWRYKPEVLIDVATLTGACVVALGERIAGVFAKDEALQADIVASGRRTHERCWPMPLPEDYRELLKSSYADISNMPSTRYGAAISAALFLSEFVGKTRWAHIDIAGPAFHKKEDAYCGPGGTGFGVRLLMDWLTNHG
ncbi:MAG: leucyl aminopeptidase [Hyphomicrobiales bacterium]